jgi:hypothetical protein
VQRSPPLKDEDQTENMIIRDAIIKHHSDRKNKLKSLFYLFQSLDPQIQISISRGVEEQYGRGQRIENGVRRVLDYNKKVNTYDTDAAHVIGFNVNFHSDQTLNITDEQQTIMKNIKNLIRETNIMPYVINISIDRIYDFRAFCYASKVIDLRINGELNNERIEEVHNNYLTDLSKRLDTYCPTWRYREQQQ